MDLGAGAVVTGATVAAVVEVGAVVVTSADVELVASVLAQADKKIAMTVAAINSRQVFT
jgi:hypothetical protein